MFQKQIIIIKVLRHMEIERVIRHRKAFYEKENDRQGGNMKHQHEKPNLFKYKTVTQNAHKFKDKHNSATKVKVQKQPKNQTEKFCDIYTFQLLQNTQNYEQPTRCLDKHKIDSGLRNRMLDWMVQVMTAYKFNHKTYFAACQLMDRYFSNQSKVLYPQNLHITGVVSMMIATKMQQVYPLKIKTVYEKIAHKKIPLQDLMGLEQQISEKLNFKLNSWTIYDIAICKVHLLLHFLNKNNRVGALMNITNQFYNSSTFEKNLIGQIENKMFLIQGLCSYLGKIMLFNYEIYTRHPMNLQAEALLKLTFQLLNIECQLQKVFTSCQVQIQLFKEQLIELCRNFQGFNKGLTNLAKFTDPQVLALIRNQL